MINSYKFRGIKLPSFLKKLNNKRFSNVRCKVEDFSNPQLREVIKGQSKAFSDWLFNRVKEGKGTKFDFSSLPEEIRENLNTVPEAIGIIDKENKGEIKLLKYDSYELCPAMREYTDLQERQGYVSQKDLNNIMRANNTEFRDKITYESPLDALKNIKKYIAEGSASETALITLQVVLNLDFDRPDHHIPGAILKLPVESPHMKDICVITSEENSSLALSCGAQQAMTAAKLASLLSENKFPHKKIIATEDQYTDLVDFCKEEIESKGLEFPSREYGTIIKKEELKNVLVLFTTNHVNVKVMKRKSQFVNASEHFNKIVHLDVGDVSMSLEDLLKNIDFVLREISQKKPFTVEGKYFLSGVLIVKGKAFKINWKAIDPQLEEYKQYLSLI